MANISIIIFILLNFLLFLTFMPLAARKLLSLSLSVSVWKKNFNCYFDRIFWCNLSVEFIPIYIMLIFENRRQVDQLSEKIQAWGKALGENSFTGDDLKITPF